MEIYKVIKMFHNEFWIMKKTENGIELHDAFICNYRSQIMPFALKRCPIGATIERGEGV